MAHEIGHAGPYGELFELPTGLDEYGVTTDTDIDFANPTPQELARIQQDPNLQMQYLQTIMGGSGSDPGYFGGETYKKWESGGMFQEDYETDVSLWGLMRSKLKSYFLLLV